jgi:hypothetical protein
LPPEEHELVDEVVDRLSKSESLVAAICNARARNHPVAVAVAVAINDDRQASA